MVPGAEASVSLSPVTAQQIATRGPSPERPSSSMPRFLDQSASALRLGLLQGEPDIDRFSVLSTSHLTRPWLRVEACVIGASHLIRFDVAGMQPFCEVLACVDLADDPGCVVSVGLRGLRRGRESSLAGGVVHRCEAKVERGGSARPRLAALEGRIEAAVGARSAGREIGLRFEFPHRPAGTNETPSLEPAGPPRTLVWLEVDDSAYEVRAETAHSYPNEDRVVFSTTRLVAPPGCSEQSG